MTLRRRISIFTFALPLLLTLVGAAGVEILVMIRPAMAGKRILGAYGIDDALKLLSGLTTMAVIVTTVLAVSRAGQSQRGYGNFSSRPVPTQPS